MIFDHDDDQSVLEMRDIADRVPGEVATTDTRDCSGRRRCRDNLSGKMRRARPTS